MFKGKKQEQRDPFDQQRRIAEHRADVAISKGLGEPNWSDLPKEVKSYAEQYWRDQMSKIYPDPKRQHG